MACKYIFTSMLKLLPAECYIIPDVFPKIKNWLTRWLRAHVPLRRLSTWPERKIPDDENNIQKINHSKAFPFFLWSKYLQLPGAIPPAMLFLHSCCCFPIYFAPHISSHLRFLHFFSVPHHPFGCINNPPRCRAAVCIFDHLLAPWPSVIEADITICLSCFCLSCCLRENNGNSQQKELKKAHPKVVLLHSASLSSSACVKVSKAVSFFFSPCAIMNMEKRVRMFWGTLLTSKVADNFLGVECLMTRDACVCFAHSLTSQVMRCTFGCLIGGVPRFLQLTWI